jgi:hypothetical protein
VSQFHTLFRLRKTEALYAQRQFIDDPNATKPGDEKKAEPAKSINLPSAVRQMIYSD